MNLRAAAAIIAAFSVVSFTGTSPAIRFREVSVAAGVKHTHQTRRFTGKHADVLRMFTSGGAAVTVGDYNNDGLDDIFLTDSNTGRPNKLYRNEGNFHFTDVTE